MSLKYEPASKVEVRAMKGVISRKRKDDCFLDDPMQVRVASLQPPYQVLSTGPHNVRQAYDLLEQ